MSKQVKVADRVFTVNETHTWKGYTLNQAKGSASPKLKFTIGMCMNLPAVGEKLAKQPNPALADLSTSDASQIFEQLKNEAKNKQPSQASIERAYKTLARMKGF